MIGSWNNDGCIFAMMPAAWKNGNGSADKASGNFPMYPSADVAMAMYYMSLGTTGYLTASGKIATDGVNDFGEVNASQALWQNGQPRSYEYIIKPQITGGTFEIFSILNDVGGSVALRLWFGGDVAGYKGFMICANTLAHFGYGTKATFHNLKQHLALTYNGNGVTTIGNWAFYIDGSPVSLSPYAGAAGTNQSKNYIFCNNVPGYFTESELWLMTAYNVELSAARVAANAALGDDYGLKGINVGDLMNLSPKGGAKGVPAGIFEGSD